MSYDVQLFKSETKTKEQSSDNENFFDDEKNLVPFTSEEIKYLRECLESYGYVQNESRADGQSFAHEEFTITALLTDRGLYFNAGFDTDSIFEAGMTASELTDSGTFEKYDPQNGGWEEL